MSYSIKKSFFSLWLSTVPCPVKSPLDLISLWLLLIECISFGAISIIPSVTCIFQLLFCYFSSKPHRLQICLNLILQAVLALHYSLFLRLSYQVYWVYWSGMTFLIFSYVCYENLSLMCIFCYCILIPV